MKTVGVVSVYSFRPHQEHLRRLVSAFEQSPDWDLKLAICGGFENCYKQTVRPNWPGFVVCAGCKLTSGLLGKSHTRLKPVSRIDTPTDEHLSWINSSLCTKYRFESPDKLDRVLEKPEADSLARGAGEMFEAAKQWIEQENLDLLVCFNCRMDLSRAVMEAARALNVPMVSLDRSWFGEGVQLTPNDTPHGLPALNRMIGEYMQKPLTESQGRRIYDLLAARVRGNLPGEFRQYNKDHQASEWVRKEGKRRVLFVPSSINEWVGHPDRASAWRHPTDAVDFLIDKGWLEPDELLVRFHPGWVQKISYTDGEDSADYYRDWCARHGIRCIESGETVSTGSLIAQCDLLVFSGSSAFFEAGMHGKPMLSLLPTPYDVSGLVYRFCGPDDLGPLGSGERPFAMRDYVTRFLRFGYAFHYRFMQYTDCLHSGAGMPQSDVERLDFFAKVADTGEILAYDGEVAESNDVEQKLISECFQVQLQVESA